MLTEPSTRLTDKLLMEDPTCRIPEGSAVALTHSVVNHLLHLYLTGIKLCKNFPCQVEEGTRRYRSSVEPSS